MFLAEFFKKLNNNRIERKNKKIENKSQQKPEKFHVVGSDKKKDK